MLQGKVLFLKPNKGVTTAKLHSHRDNRLQGLSISAKVKSSYGLALSNAGLKVAATTTRWRNVTITPTVPLPDWDMRSSFADGRLEPTLVRLHGNGKHVHCLPHPRYERLTELRTTI